MPQDNPLKQLLPFHYTNGKVQTQACFFIKGQLCANTMPCGGSRDEFNTALALDFLTIEESNVLSLPLVVPQTEPPDLADW